MIVSFSPVSLNKIKKCKLFMIAFMLILLSGCGFFNKDQMVNNTQTYYSTPFAVRQQTLSALNQWQLNGSFSIQPAGQMPVIANYDWQQYSTGHYRINISAPLNLMTAVIVGQPGWVSLRSSQGAASQAGSAELLMQNVLGWSLPVSNLVYWVRGLPAAATPVSNEYFDGYGHLVALSQDGWYVRFSRYQTISPNMDLPRQIDLQRPGLTVKILAKTWNAPLGA